MWTARAAAGKDGPRVLHGELLLEQRANEASGGFSIRTGVEVRPVLGPDKDAALETDQGDPLGLAPGPADGGERLELARAVQDRGARAGAGAGPAGAPAARS